MAKKNSTDNGWEVTFKNFRKLCIKNVEHSETDENIRSICEEYGHLLEFYRIPGKTLAFAVYRTER